MKTTRTYTMRARAQQADRTRARILEAAVALAGERPLAACTLPAVVERAGVSVQTVLRIFGSRDGLFEAARVHSETAVLAERHADPDDVEASLASLADHYELRGDAALLLLGQESWEPFAARITASGKRLHRDWVARVFARTLDRLSGDRRDEGLDLLVAATDVTTWKLWRHDRALGHDESLARMRELVASVCARLDPDTPH